MKKFFLNSIFILTIGFLFSCQSVENANQPENLIPEDQMVNVLTDLLRLDAAEGYSTIEFEKREVTTKDLIFKKYSVDSLQFAKSTAYYAENFKLNERIYDRVQERLEHQKNIYDSLIEVEKDTNKELQKINDEVRKVRLKEGRILDTIN
ncbi:DUF4296 domain-containing protein [Mesonia aestuariivivens]|uniref:DUF4296 domain-containing protein n=1 Tax=Mesonia aestuariivivens TaxID=2796128 RepID=A0ABS6VY13_9FLAO|nr:DUF4296 domain-containing protein [Mesonia aestuariivivens]MBW2960473.1 DUF4296 domain-containing protein [Mesonia aestuariivivens]